MKILTSLFAFIFLSTGIYAQVNINNSNTVYTTNLTYFVYPSVNPILKAAYSVKNLVDGRQGIQFSFLISAEKEMQVVNMDSIIITSSDFNILTLHKKYTDSVEDRLDLKISYNTVHILSNDDIKFLKEKMISGITIFINKSPIVIRIDKKSQKLFNKEMKANFLN